MLINNANVHLTRRVLIAVARKLGNIDDSPVRAQQSKTGYERDFGSRLDTHAEHDTD